MTNIKYVKHYPKAMKKRITGLLILVLMGCGIFGKVVGEDLQKDSLHIVFLISEDPDNYDAHLTIPEFANNLTTTKKYKTTVLKGESKRTSYRFPNFEILKEADLVVVFARRLALATDQMAILKNYFQAGGGLIGIRTANHAFTLLPGEKAEEGYEQWPEFVPDVLGCMNRGYGLASNKTRVLLEENAAKHDVLLGITQNNWVSDGNLYLVDPLLAKDAKILLTGISDHQKEPIAWCRQYGQSRIFYTSLGYPTDFKNKNFIRMLTGAIAWVTAKDT